MNPSNEVSQIKSLMLENRERMKELTCINQTIRILKSGQPIEEILRQVCLTLPLAWLHGDQAVARIRFGELEIASPGFKETEWRQAQYFKTVNNMQGVVEVFYLQEYPVEEEGPFLKEERNLIDNLTVMIATQLDSVEAGGIMQQQQEEERRKALQAYEKGQTQTVNSRQLLQRFLANQNTTIDTLHSLMPFKVKEILMVATLYDTFSIEKDGRFTEHIMGEHYQLNIISMPRITGVTTVEEAMEQLKTKHFDLIIIMGGTDRRMPFSISHAIREQYPYLPVFLLLSHTNDLAYFKERIRQQATIDKIFVWNGSTKVFYAMVKYLEDRMNVANDTQVGLIKVILLVEDSEIYYSKYLPLLYTSVVEQTRNLVEEVNADNIIKALRTRLRPKVLLASDYEEAMEIAHKYSDNLMCLITDVEFPVNDILAADAGFLLVRGIREMIPELPVVIQSAERDIAHKAFELKSTFIGKNSDTLMQDIRSFINHQMGFGNFVYRDGTGKKIVSVRSIQEFEKQIDTIPDESLVYHARHNHFSLWLMARGEIKIAKMIYLIKVTDFDNLEEYRKYMKFVLGRYRNESNAGRVIDFDEQALFDEQNIVSLSGGNLGGKGRGLAFVNTLIYNLQFSDIIPGINICTPRTAVIGTDEFEIFIERNDLLNVVQQEKDYDSIKWAFLQSELSHNLTRRLKAYLKYIKGPIAVRSSSLYEDSSSQPFSGVFETYLLPNNSPDDSVRLQQLTEAIRLVYASLYAPGAREYFRAINYGIDNEKMAVVLQEVVGNQYDQYFYPHISGTAQSYNYYPVAHMAPEDGFAVCAVGLGKYVVDGGKSYRFSPKYPTLETLSPQEQFKNSQTKLLALDLSNTEPDLLQDGEMAAIAELDISVAEQHGVLQHCASVYTADDRLEPGLNQRGPRVINFADLLRYNHIPLASTIELILDVVKEAMGTPVEIEFSINLHRDPLNPPALYLLQIKPIIEFQTDYELAPDSIDAEHTILFSTKTMGNGQIDHITDVIYVDINTFDKTDTVAIAAEIEQFNKLMVASDQEYILIGPGRWGSRDRFIGIPVTWPQISSAKVVVEVGLPDLPLDPSLGSHFFHNVISMHVGYFSIPSSSPSDFIRWEVLEQQQLIRQTKYLKHVRFAQPLNIRMDGMNRKAAVDKA